MRFFANNTLLLSAPRVFPANPYGVAKTIRPGQYGFLSGSSSRITDPKELALKPRGEGRELFGRLQIFVKQNTFDERPYGNIVDITVERSATIRYIK